MLYSASLKLLFDSTINMINIVDCRLSTSSYAAPQIASHSSLLEKRLAWAYSVKEYFKNQSDVGRGHIRKIRVKQFAVKIR